MPYTADDCRELLECARYGEEDDLADLKRLLEAGVPVDYADDGGNSGLHKACANGHVDIARALMAAGATHAARVPARRIIARLSSLSAVVPARRVEPKATTVAFFSPSFMAGSKNAASRGLEPGQPPSMYETPKASSRSATASFDSTVRSTSSP